MTVNGHNGHPVVHEPATSIRADADHVSLAAIGSGVRPRPYRPGYAAAAPRPHVSLVELGVRPRNATLH
jgi:hypothetical protein